jgi:hypothetical protein
MPRIVGVHGIGQQFEGPNTLHVAWAAALRDGVILAGKTPPPGDDLVCAFYGDLFRLRGTKSLGLPPYDAGDVTDAYEQDLLAAWWRGAAEAEPGQVVSPDAVTKMATPRLVQSALDALSHSAFFAGLAERAFIGDLKQVSAYFHDDALRRAVMQRVEAVVGDGYDLRLMSWGDGTGVPTSGSSLVIVGTDNKDLLHIRVFDPNGKQATDTDETQLPEQAAAIATLKQQLPGLLPPHVLTAAEKTEVIREATSIVGQTLGDDTRVMIGHSLGSVVAYECLCAHPEWPVTTLVTLGAPLGIANLIFDRLRPPPVDGLGAWPGKVRRWFNIADGGDVVALVKDLRSRFGSRVENLRIHNGATAHAIRPYLTARETGDAIASGLA